MSVASHPTMAAIERHFAVQCFLFHEAHLLDTRQFETWRDLFTEDGRYWVPLKPDQKSPDAEASLFYDDRRIMATRFERLGHPHIHSQTPHHRTCHLVNNVALGDWNEADRELHVTSNLIMTDYRLRATRVFSGRVTHRLREADGSFRIAMKKVELINCDDVFELIAVPF
jgi:3-phenylpropionate/cinnamic acid dioxygenase small subunit